MIGETCRAGEMRFLATSAIRVVAPCCCAIGPAGWALDFAPGNREGPTLESFLDGRRREAWCEKKECRVVEKSNLASWLRGGIGHWPMAHGILGLRS